MTCADDAGLWAWAHGGLPPEERALLSDHLSQCGACQRALVRVDATRAVLREAKSFDPSVDWRQVDDAVMGAATVQFARRQRTQPFWAFAGAIAAAALAFALWPAVSPGPTTGPIVPVDPVRAALDVQVEEAREARFIEAAGPAQVLENGVALHQGVRIQTDTGGRAVMRLPEASRARLGADTDAVLQRASVDAVDIQLNVGAVLVEASHAAREQFVIEAEEGFVRVVGTVFRVSRREGQLVVAVSEGRVLVQPRGGGQSRLVDAGARLVLGPEGALLEEAPLAAEDRAAFAQLEAPVRPEPRGPTPPGPPRGVPRPASAPAAAPAVSAPGIRLEDLATPEFNKDTFREKAAAGLPLTAEALFLRRAEDALRTGGCGGFLLGLGDITETSEDASARETARIFRARCFDDRLQPVEAENEYRKYLHRFSRGRFADEARRALAH